MSYIGGPLPGQEKTEEEQEESLNKALSTGKKIAGALIPDLTDPRETAEYFTDLVSDIKLTRSPIKGAGVFAGKRLMADLPVVRRAVDAGQEIAKPIIKKAQDFLNKDYFEPVYDSIGVQPRNLLSEGVNTRLNNKPLVSNVFASTNTLTKLPPSISDVQIARKFKGESTFIKEISAKTSRMKDLINKTADKRGWTDLSKYKGKDNYITTPKGEKFRYMWKDGRYSWRSMTSEGKRALKRLTGEGADLKSIEPLFRKHFNPTQAKEASALYVETQRVVNSKIRTAITKYNKTVPDSKKLSLEHIFDVHFYDRIKKDVPSFSGRGANELGNVTAMKKLENMISGSKNKKIDPWDAVIETIKRDKGFPDYDKVISQFIYEDVGNVVANFTQKDWDEFIGQFLKREGDTAQEIIIEMTRKRN